MHAGLLPAVLRCCQPMPHSLLTMLHASAFLLLLLLHASRCNLCMPHTTRWPPSINLFSQHRQSTPEAIADLSRSFPAAAALAVCSGLCLCICCWPLPIPPATHFSHYSSTLLRAGQPVDDGLAAAGDHGVVNSHLTAAQPCHHCQA